MKLNKRLNLQTTTTTSPEGLITFTMSTPAVDRVGDRVMPDWDLSDFMKNPIALFQHNLGAIIGTWGNVKVIGNELVGDLRLAQRGTSALVDEVTALIEQGILKAVSIGFSSEDARENDFGGRDLYKNRLLECSVVSVPANQEALRKALHDKLSPTEIESICTMDGCSLSKSRGESSLKTADTQPAPQTKTVIKTKGLQMNFGERIKALSATLTTANEELKALNEKADLSNADMDRMAELSADIGETSEKIKKFEAMEKNVGNTAVATKAAPATPKFDGKAVKGGVIKGIVAMAKAHTDNIPVETAVQKMYKGDKAVSVFAKAATNAAPAMTGVPEWAGNLTQEGYGAYLEDLTANTIFGQVAGMRISFGKDAAINIPYRDGKGTLAGDFVAEGDPIPVKQDKFATLKLAPSKLGVITTFTKEIMRKSTPAIEGLLRNHMMQDTAEVLDKVFLDATAASAVRPAGLEALAGAGNIVASAGSTVGDIEKDIQGAFERMSALNLGGSGTIVMNPARKRGLDFKQNALGQYPFKGRDFLEGFNVVTSTNVPTDKVYIIDSKALIFGLDQGVEFEASTQATLVMAAPADAIGDGTKVTTEPVRSLYQTDTLAIKQTLALTWALARKGGVQILTNVDY